MAPTIALIAHNRKKDDIVAFANQHATLLSRYRLIATGATGQRLQDATGLPIVRMLSGPLGGDAQIAAEVALGKVVAVIFLIDSLYAQPHEPDIQALLRVCEVHNVALATNLATAAAIMAKLQSTRLAHLIFNPVSGQDNPEEALATIQRLLTPEIHLHVHQTTPNTQAKELAQQAIASGADLVIAAGGDGTVSAVAGAVIGTQIPLGIIPRGTANAFAAALGIPSNLQAACATILTGTIKTIDAAQCNGQPMVLLTGIGFEAETVERANREVKDRFGALAYIMAGVQQLSEQELFTTQVEIDGNVSEFQATAITVANAAPATSVLAQGFGQVVVDDGLLDVTIGAPKTTLQAVNTMVHLLGAALIRITPSREDIVCLQAKQLTIATDPPQKVVVDGEIIGTTPVHLNCLPRALRVFTPAPSIQSWLPFKTQGDR